MEDIMSLVSVICVYNKTFILREQLLKSFEIQNMDYELILIDNRNNKFSNAASALNHGAEQANGEYLMFIHQDIIIDNPNWLEQTINQIKKLHKPGIVGVAGKTNDRFIRTNILHGIPARKVSPFQLQKPEEASTVDECLFIIPKKVFNLLQFDEKTCFDWHLYATDYLLSVRKLGYKAYIIPTNIIHASEGASMSEGYYQTMTKLQKKHFDEHIIRNCMADWYTYIPVPMQRKMKAYNKKSDDVKLNYIDKIIYNRNADKNYKKIDENTANLIKSSGLFDANYYKKKYHIDTNKYDPLSHFMTVGYKKHYNPSLKFDTEDYYLRYPDVKHVELNPLLHYLKWGKNEGRRINRVKTKKEKIKKKLLNSNSLPTTYLLLKSKLRPKLFMKYKNEFDSIKSSGLFDEEFYEKYSGVSDFKNDPVVHYMFLGKNMNYKPNKFLNVDYYKRKYGNNENPLLMYLKYEKDLPIVFNKSNEEEYTLIKNSGLFDETYYMENYPETQEYSMNLISHYINVGYKKGYNPSEYFDTNWYLTAYPNVKNSNMNPLFHYLKYGQYEKKITTPMSDTEANELINIIDTNARKEKLRKFDSNSPLVSIIILTRNGLDYLKTLFKDFKETICYPNYEIIVVDNDSTDDSVKYLKTLTESLPLRIIENKTNESFSEANNKAVEQSNGEYVLLLNNDMEPVYGWLNHMMNSYLKDDDIGIVGAKLIYPYRENNPTSLTTQNEGIKYTELNGFLEKNDGYIVPYNIKENKVYNNDDKEQEIASILGASLLIKKDLYQSVGGLDDNYIYNYEDIDLCFKIIQEGYKVIYSPKAKLYHYYQATRDEAFDLSPRDMKNRIYLYKKWNTWLCEQLFIDKINNRLIFSEKPMNITFISEDNQLLEDDPLIINEDLENYNYTEKFNPDYEGITVKDIGWQVTPLIYEDKKISVKKNTDLLITDVTTLNPNSIQKNNVHQIKIAIINKNIAEWEKSEFLNKFDLIFVSNNYFDLFKEFENATRLFDSKSIFLQIKNKLTELYEKDLEEFDKILKNKSFEDTISFGKDYSIISDSEYFDEKWYMEHYDISDDHLDPTQHYLNIGGQKGYDPSERFSSKEYYECNPDVKNAKINPLLHFEKFGAEENRKINQSDDASKSYKKFLSLTSEKRYPLTKKLFKTNENQIFFYSPWSDEKYGKLNENSEMIFNNINKKYDKKIYTNKKMASGDYLEVLHNLLESKVIVIDQGMGLLSQLKLKEDQKVVNIWHACGAFKTIGYDSPVYNDMQLKEFAIQFPQYTNFIVSSPKITNIYAYSHGMDEKDVLGLGVPRTDLFFDENYKQEKLRQLYEKYPSLKDKEIILYAPTFRDTYKLDTQIDWDVLSKKLDSNEVFIIKRHIRIKEDLLDGKEYDNIFYLEEEDITLFTLMFASKLMITDYSSVIFEYSLLDKPVIHYCPDYEKYLSVREFYLDFDNELYGEIIETPEELIEKLTSKDYELDTEKLDAFKDKFMSACDGHATERVVELIEKYMEE